MKRLEIISIPKKKFPKKKSRITGEEKRKIINLVKGLNIVRINQVWTTDITYIKTKEGTFYLISFMDLFSRKIVGWELCKDQRKESIIKVFKKAFNDRKPKPGLIVHSDKGAQFRSFDYRAMLEKHHCLASYTSLNHSCDENTWQESFHAQLKKERIYLTKLNTFEDAQREIYDYIEGFYNLRRSHSSIGYLSPIQFEKSLISPSQNCLII